MRHSPPPPKKKKIKQALTALAGRPALFRPAAPLPRSVPAKATATATAMARQRRRRRRLFPSTAAAAAPSSSSSSDSSAFSSSSVAQMAPSGAVLLCAPPPKSSRAESEGGGTSSSSSSSSSSSDGASSFEDKSAASAAVVVVGVDHGDPDPSLGAFILSSGPAAVVVETALCARHGAETGTSLSLLNEEDDGGSAGLGGFGGGGGGARWETGDGEEMKPLSPFEAAEEEPHVAQCLGLAGRLASLPAGSPERTAFWQALSQHFAGEQLAYVAALSRGARLVFGDRPKRETVRRLLDGRVLSAADLDRAVAAQAARNTLESLTGGVAPPPSVADGGGFGRAYDVLVRERDAAICSAVAREVVREEERAARCSGGGGGGGETDDGDDASSSSSSASTTFPPSASSSSSSSRSPRPIVVIVGKWHLEGVRSLWESGEWRSVLQREEEEEEEAAEEGERDDSAAAALLLLPSRHPSLSAAEDLGLRRALVDELLRSTATADSAEEVDPEAFGGPFVAKKKGDAAAGGAGGEIDEEEEAAARAAYALTAELYGTARMQLALLDSRQQFDAVASGWRCDFWEAVEPVRSVRAANGGKGFFDEEELIEKLRGLNYIFEETK